MRGRCAIGVGFEKRKDGLRDQKMDAQALGEVAHLKILRKVDL